VRRNVLVATFTDADALMSAVPAMRRENLRVHDVYAPYPIHGLDRAMGLRRTKLPWVTLLAGLLGLTFAVTFRFYTNVFDWPLNVGGKPDNSSLAFVPICFELTVLIGGLATVLALFVRAKLYPGRRERLVAGGVTNNTFALVLRKPNESFDTRRACKILEDCGAHEIEEKEAEL
jgi:hypothetical protein